MAPPPVLVVSVVIDWALLRDHTPACHMLGVGFTGVGRTAAPFWKREVSSPVMSAEIWLAGEATTPSFNCCAIPLVPGVGT